MSTKKSVARFNSRRANSVPTKKSGGQHINLIGLSLTVLMQVLTVGYVYGSVTVRLSTVEGTLAEHRSELRVVSDVKQDIAVAKTRLDAISSSLEKIEQSLARSRGR